MLFLSWNTAVVASFIHFTEKSRKTLVICSVRRRRSRLSQPVWCKLTRWPVFNRSEHLKAYSHFRFNSCGRSFETVTNNHDPCLDCITKFGLSKIHSEDSPRGFFPAGNISQLTTHCQTTFISLLYNQARGNNKTALPASVFLV